MHDLDTGALMAAFVEHAKAGGAAFADATADEADAHLDKAVAAARELHARGRSADLAPLLGPDHDPFVSYEAAKALLSVPEFRDEALAALERIAEAHVGAASSFARAERNVALHGVPFPELEAEA